MGDYLKINKKSWNERVALHLKSDFYGVSDFISGKSSLNQTELQILGNLQGKKLLHLQCHFGQDSISLSRLGAKVTGVDFSEEAINAARNLAVKCGTDTRFICTDVYRLPEVLDEKFDLVFTSYGVLGWLPDLDQWGKVVSRFLKPGGKLVLVEFHPLVWMFDDEFQHFKYSYFNQGEISETIEGTYADKDCGVSLEEIVWNHSLSDVVNAIVQNGMKIQSLNEYDFSPYNCFRNTVEVSPQKFMIKSMEGIIPVLFSVEALKEEPN